MEKFKLQYIFLPASPIGMPESMSLEKMNIIFEGVNNVELNYVDRIVLTPQELKEFAITSFNKGIDLGMNKHEYKISAKDEEAFLQEFGLEESVFPTAIPERDNHHE